MEHLPIARMLATRPCASTGDGALQGGLGNTPPLPPAAATPPAPPESDLKLTVGVSASSPAPCRRRAAQFRRLKCSRQTSFRLLLPLTPCRNRRGSGAALPMPVRAPAAS